ncbi:NPC intracellular cholesterol transporter 2 homolog a-like isoform X2 [Phymastichus coffea]|uniref:NPC intracellular cholesterol transporter 2 homolog a-like isoform X2 n=1 Tax=Phymastichus coffea TaxID=108790 RepID=UPI00273B7CE8|nr:NPC intracellular cholesterol transporter 2 homolog a-like isoform X2 [Phymastichus coffea]
MSGFILAAMLVASPSQATPVKSCDRGAPPKEVRIDGCDKLPCQFVRGKNITAEWDFVVEKDTKILTPDVHATVFGNTVKYPFYQNNACDTLKDAKCPLDAGEEVTYQLNMFVETTFPKVPLDIEFAFLDDHSETVVCFQLSAEIVD